MKPEGIYAVFGEAIGMGSMEFWKRIKRQERLTRQWMRELHDMLFGTLATLPSKVAIVRLTYRRTRSLALSPLLCMALLVILTLVVAS